MTVLREGDLELRLPAEALGRRFDDASHGLSHCMKAVDFIIELADKILFIEFKDPEHPRARPAAQAAFVKEFQNGEIDSSLVIKYRDSLRVGSRSCEQASPLFRARCYCFYGRSDAAAPNRRAQEAASI